MRRVASRDIPRNLNFSKNKNLLKWLEKGFPKAIPFKSKLLSMMKPGYMLLIQKLLIDQINDNTENTTSKLGQKFRSY